MDARTFALKLRRYAMTAPVDFVRCVFFWTLLALLFPRALCCGVNPSSRRGYLSWTRILLMVEGVFPAQADCEMLLQVLQHSSLALRKWPLVFCSLPRTLEIKWLGFYTPELHHLARLYLVQKELPRAKRILDLGGSSGGIPQGALLFMGYPHEPAEVVVVDLPPTLQGDGYRQASLAKNPPGDFVHGNTTRVRTIYTSMCDLSQLPAASFDLVWSGQSLEHVSRAEALRTFCEVERVLSPGGLFCFDTPNRELSSLLSRVGMLHPGHKIEYTADELRVLAEEAGFSVSRMLAVTALPLSKKIGRFCRVECQSAALVDNDAEQGLSVFVECKPNR
jgi:SAM-dependent methyltransferase